MSAHLTEKTVKVQHLGLVELFYKGTSLGKFVPDGKWNGMIKYADPQTGREIIVREPATRLFGIFDEVFGRTFDSDNQIIWINAQMSELLRKAGAA